MAARNQPPDGAAHQLEARDRQKDHDRERAERLELAVAVRMVLVGLLGRYPHDHETQHVIRRIHRGMQGVAEYSE